MRNIQNIDISLKEIVKNIRNNNYLIPKFQRDFVWNTKDISDLGDSIIRGYPISSLLTMPENGTLKVGATNLVKSDFTGNNDNQDSETKNYILDGQQRMTSISKLFLSYDNKNEYYFDLLAILTENFPDDKICDQECIKNKFLKSKLDDSFCRPFQIGKNNDEKPTRGNNRFISGKAIIGDKSGSIINKFLRGFSDDEFSDDQIDKYTDSLNAILNSVGGYSIPATVISSDSELGVVIRVFEKVNSTGKKLTLFDLINAKSFETKNEDYKGGLSDYLKNEILSKIDENNYLKLGVNKFFKFDDNEQVFEKIDKIIRIFEVASLLENNNTPSIFQSTMLKKDADFWFDMWVTKGELLLKVVSWMNDEGLIDIGQITFLEYAVAILLANEKSFQTRRFKEEIKKYSIYLRLTGSSFNKSNLDIVEKLYEISKGLANSNGFDKYEYVSPIGKPSLNKDNILNATTSTAIFQAIKILFYKDKIGGKFTVDIMGNQIKDIETSMDDHHIYPKSKVKNFSTKSEFNSIANIAYIDSTLNRVDIKDKKPYDYFGEIANNTQAEFNCNQNLINIDEIKNIDSENKARLFIEKRADEIANLINEYF
jgi:uncharacterized protein with ParB-like and HNH nuclease domain